MNLTQRLRELRFEKNLKQSEVAECLGISVSCYGGYEQGYREPDLKTLIKISQFYNVTTDYLLGLEN